MSTPTITTLVSTSKTTLISHPPEISTNARDASLKKISCSEANPLPTITFSFGNTNRTTKSWMSSGPRDTSTSRTTTLNPSSPKIYQLTTRKKDKLPEIKPQPVKTTTTPSIRSESSWNSRSALLQTVPKDQQPKHSNKKSFFARIGCNCSCADKNSVEHVVDENKTDRFVNGYGSVKLNEPEQLKIKREAHLTFPVFNPKPGDQAAEKIKTRAEEKDVTKRPSSLQVFGGPESGIMCSGLEKKLAMMTWDAIIAPEEIKTIPSISSDMLGGDGGDSDASDASSDLFEIESLSIRGAHNSPFRTASDGCKSPTATTCYAPSEASVVTASAADFEELNGSNSDPTPGRKKLGSIKEMPRLRSGILSGCMSKKAIRVGGDENGFGGGRRNLRTESLTSAMTKFRDDIKFDVRNRQRSSFDAPVLSSRRSGNAAHLLYT